MRAARGFTMMEVLIVVVIMAVLAGLAVPSYFHTVEQARSNEAKTNLNIIHMGQKIYRLNNGTFWSAGNPSIADINNALGVDMSAAYYTTATVNANGGNSYSARLTRNAAQGGTSSKWFQYNYSNGDASPALSEGGSY